MEREVEVIELGAATAETKGPLAAPGDDHKGIAVAGLADD